MTNAPLEDLIRKTEREFEIRADTESDGRTLFGYMAKFNEPTEINSWEGNFREVIAPGAFKRTIKNNGSQVKILFNHGMDPQIGDKPLGRATVLKEDTTGLYVEVPLSRTSYNDDIIELLKDGALDGMSFRFSVVKETWQEPTRKNDIPTRTLNEVRLHEGGVVTFPAYLATTAGVRSRESLDRWNALDDEAREAIANILGTSFEARGTGSSELAGSNADDSDAVAAAHHSARTRFLQWKAQQTLAS